MSITEPPPDCQDTDSISKEEGSYSSSRTWTGFQPPEKARFLRVYDKHRQNTSILARSPFIPLTLVDWIAHRLGIILEEIEMLKALIKAYQETTSCLTKVMPAFGGKTLMLRSVCSLDPHSRLGTKSCALDDVEENCLAETQNLEQRQVEDLIGADLLSRLSQ